MLCRHCRRGIACRPGRLCWPCYYRPGVRPRYLSTSKFVRRGHGIHSGDENPPAFPTLAPPGSAEKIAVMCERARLRQTLFHPDDATDAFAPALDEAG